MLSDTATKFLSQLQLGTRIAKPVHRDIALINILEVVLQAGTTPLWGTTPLRPLWSHHQTDPCFTCPCFTQKSDRNQATTITYYTRPNSISRKLWHLHSPLFTTLSFSFPWLVEAEPQRHSFGHGAGHLFGTSVCAFCLFNPDKDTVKIVLPCLLVRYLYSPKSYSDWLFARRDRPSHLTPQSTSRNLMREREKKKLKYKQHTHTHTYIFILEPTP